MTRRQHQPQDSPTYRVCWRKCFYSEGLSNRLLAYSLSFVCLCPLLGQSLWAALSSYTWGSPTPRSFSNYFIPRYIQTTWEGTPRTPPGQGLWPPAPVLLAPFAHLLHRTLVPPCGVCVLRTCSSSYTHSQTHKESPRSCLWVSCGSKLLSEVIHCK